MFKNDNFQLFLEKEAKVYLRKKIDKISIHDLYDIFFHQDYVVKWAQIATFFAQTIFRTGSKILFEKKDR